MPNWERTPQGLTEQEQKLDSHLSRLEERLMEHGEEISIPVDVNFPKEFEEQSQEISTGPLHWRKFFSDEGKEIYSLHCQMDSGILVREHFHPEYDEYIYVVHGKLINWSRANPSGQVIIPPEQEYIRRSPNVSGWHQVPAGMPHRLQATEDNTHAVLKFMPARS